MESEKQVQKFHTDDVSLPRSGLDLGSASDCLKQIFSQLEPLPCHQQGISALGPQTLFRGETRGAIGKFTGCFLRL